MRIACVSDLHGHLPAIPDADVLLIGGDLVPITHHDPAMSAAWLDGPFRRWLGPLASRMRVVAVAGNHDFVFQDAPEMVPDLAWTYLQDSETEVGGLKIFGSPHQPPFMDWAFNLPEDELARRWAAIPDDADILLLHGPPRGYGDRSPFGREHVGSPSLAERIREVRPRLVVAGHIHSGHGRYMIGETLCINASLLDERYRPAYPVEVVELD